MQDKTENFTLSEQAAKSIIEKLLQDLENIKPAGSDFVEVKRVEDRFEVSLNLQIAKDNPILETGEKVQEILKNKFKDNTGFELERINLYFESIYE